MKKLLIIAVLVSILWTPLEAGAVTIDDWFPVCDPVVDWRTFGHYIDAYQWKYYEVCGQLPEPPYGYAYDDYLDLVWLGY